MKLKDPLFFIHIPKTAGTSFRNELEQRFTKRRVLADYGKSGATTRNLEKRLAAPREKRNWDVLTGHVRADKYGGLFDLRRIVTFVRGPRAQVLSHWQHRVRHHGYTGTLNEFIESGSGVGILSRYTAGVPVQLLGFVGVTERYDESLGVLRSVYGLEVQSRRDNVKPTGVADDTLPIDVESLSVRARNRLRRDALLYLQANRVLNERVRTMALNVPWVHGAITSMTRRKIMGVAYPAEGERRFLPLQISVNGKVQGLCCTGPVDADVSGLVLGKQYKNECFKFHFPAPLRPGDVVDVTLPDTGQWIDSQVWRLDGGIKHCPVPMQSM